MNTYEPLAPQIMKKCNIKQYNFTCNKLAKMENIDTTQFGQECGEIGSFTYF